jgi:c(7)-type cytochrome triheme protein
MLQEIEGLKRALAESQAMSEAKANTGLSATTSVAKTEKLPIEQAKSWKEANALLPKDMADHVDWDEALAQRLIEPRASSDPSEPAQAVFDLDVELATSRAKTFNVTLSHAGHTKWLTCQNCHPGIFPIKHQAPPAVVTMGKIRQGKFCGACHGPVAFGVERSCERCHAEIPAKKMWSPSEAPLRPIEQLHKWEEAKRMLPIASDGETDWTTALVRGVISPRPAISQVASDEPILASDVVRLPAGMEDYQIIFPHTAHTAWLNCESCHPEPFQMQAGATSMSMDQINEGQLCGRCHGTVAFPVSACNRCHTTMEAGP